MSEKSTQRRRGESMLGKFEILKAASAEAETERLEARSKGAKRFASDGRGRTNTPTNRSSYFRAIKKNAATKSLRRSVTCVRGSKSAVNVSLVFAKINPACLTWAPVGSDAQAQKLLASSSPSRQTNKSDTSVDRAAPWFAT